MKLALVVGTRPQIIKSVPLIRKAPEMAVIHTGQHYDPEMSANLFRCFGIPRPSAILGCRNGVAEMTAAVRKELERIRPDKVIIPGDTDSALAGAIAAGRLGIPIAHLEAGARCGDETMKEEANRIRIDTLSSTLFAVSQNCADNLWTESMGGKVVKSGDTMWELFKDSRRQIVEDSIVEELNLTPKEYVVLTLHRAEKSQEEYARILKEVTALGKRVVFPVHPRVHSVEGIKPLNYFQMLKLIRGSLAVFTDSGGLQKEAFWSKVPCATLRPSTEWTETVELGWNTLGKIALPSKGPRNCLNPYMGDGQPSATILKELDA